MNTEVKKITVADITETGTATYCPEDDKIRLYVGRVPREEYEFLREQGWTSTPKQTCDFVAVWSCERENTALAYSGGVIEDEDMSPADRAADRAERFSGYRDKRADEAMDKADVYEAGPKLLGHQSAELAERKERALDRAGTKAVNLWDKAEYWQMRTAGVIGHALHKSAPGVRMGRIKMLEAEVRRVESKYTGEQVTYDGVDYIICGSGRDQHAVEVSKIEGRKAAYARYLNHLNLRLAYENQMLEAQGGRAASVDMVPGGWLGSHQVMKVNKSPATGRVVSVAVKVQRVEGWAYKIANVPGTDYALMTIETERLNKEVYRAPTAEELAAFDVAKKAEKKTRAETAPKVPPLINPTIEDAEKLQSVWNDKASKGGRWCPKTDKTKPVMSITQAQYSEHSKGAYSHCETLFLKANGEENHVQYRGNVQDGAAFKVRVCGYDPRQVIIITDKPQKPLPGLCIENPTAEEKAV
jgi:hypothetical protein